MLGFGALHQGFTKAGVYDTGTVNGTEETCTGENGAPNEPVGNGEQESGTGYRTSQGGGGITAKVQVGDQNVASQDMNVGEFRKSSVVVDGQTIEYTSYRISDDSTNVGTYYPVDN